ncbi:MAG: MopE-related protein [Candidatus Binatia bacterium]
MRFYSSLSVSWLPSCFFLSLPFSLLISLFCPSPAEALTLAESTLKATLTLDKTRPNADKLTVQGRFQLDTGSDGANPATEAVTLTVGAFSQILPAGAFTQKGTPPQATWTFKGATGGLTKLVITQASEQWTFNANASGITLAGTTNPIPITVQIGNDSGALTLVFAVTDRPQKAIFKFPAGAKGDADGDGVSVKRGDCDDQNPLIFPGAPELCNSTDDNCNITTDEGFDVGAACTAGMGACVRSGVRVCSGGGDGTVCDATPGTPITEICGNGVDEDCNGADLPCTGAEVCNGIDDDADGSIDEGFDVGAACTAGVGACTQSGAKVCTTDGGGTMCNATPGTPTTEICGNGIDEDCTGADLPCPPLAISITAPQNLALVNQARQTVSGTADPTAVAVSCNNIPAATAPGTFSVEVTLHEGPNTITCVATDATGKVGTASISVTLDTMPPRITINTPRDGAMVTTQAITVSGMVNDIVVGTVGELQALVLRFTIAVIVMRPAGTGGSESQRGHCGGLRS